MKRDVSPLHRIISARRKSQSRDWTDTIWSGSSARAAMRGRSSLRRSVMSPRRFLCISPRDTPNRARACDWLLLLACRNWMASTSNDYETGHRTHRDVHICSCNAAHDHLRSLAQIGATLRFWPFWTFYRRDMRGTPSASQSLITPIYKSPTSLHGPGSPAVDTVSTTKITSRGWRKTPIGSRIAIWTWTCSSGGMQMRTRFRLETDLHRSTCEC